METCVVVSQHPRNHHHHHPHDHGRMGRSGGGLYFSSPPPSRSFRSINCRAFHYGAGILPPPLSAFSSSSTSASASSTRPRSDLSSPRSIRSELPSPRSSRSDIPSPRSSHTELPSPRSEPPRRQPSRRSSPIPITTKRTTSLPSQSTAAGSDSGSLFGEDSNSSSSHTELWAGPAYSNSPPPSSLPIPKFNLRGKRSMSIELPEQLEHEDLRPLPKSAPTTPSRESTSSPSANRFFSDAFATWDLCRMLNLNLDDEE